MTYEPKHRAYTDAELKAFRSVYRNELGMSDDPALRGPAQYATGEAHSERLRLKADELERRAIACRIAAGALERVMAQEAKP